MLTGNRTGFLVKTEKAVSDVLYAVFEKASNRFVNRLKLRFNRFEPVFFVNFPN